MARNAREPQPTGKPTYRPVRVADRGTRGAMAAAFAAARPARPVPDPVRHATLAIVDAFGDTGGEDGGFGSTSR